MASSSMVPGDPAPSADPNASQFIDWGPALPESSGRPRILALVRDPRAWFASWEEGDRIRARDLTAGTSVEHVVGRTGARYFEGLPEHEYEVELFSGGKSVATSARIKLPRQVPATAVDPDWTPSPGQEDVLRSLRGTDEPAPEDGDSRAGYGGRQRRIAGKPVSRPSRSS